MVCTGPRFTSFYLVFYVNQILMTYVPPFTEDASIRSAVLSSCGCFGSFLSCSISYLLCAGPGFEVIHVHSFISYKLAEGEGFEPSDVLPSTP